MSVRRSNCFVSVCAIKSSIVCILCDETPRAKGIRKTGRQVSPGGYVGSLPIILLLFYPFCAQTSSLSRNNSTQGSPCLRLPLLYKVKGAFVIALRTYTSLKVPLRARSML